MKQALIVKGLLPGIRGVALLLWHLLSQQSGLQSDIKQMGWKRNVFMRYLHKPHSGRWQLCYTNAMPMIHLDIMLCGEMS